MSPQSCHLLLMLCLQVPKSTLCLHFIVQAYRYRHRVSRAPTWLGIQNGTKGSMGNPPKLGKAYHSKTCPYSTRPSGMHSSSPHENSTTEVWTGRSQQSNKGELANMGEAQPAQCSSGHDADNTYSIVSNGIPADPVQLAGFWR